MQACRMLGLTALLLSAGTASAGALRFEADAGTVADVMTHNVEVNHPHDQITDVATSMLDHKHRRRPIVINGKLVGQVTCRQILKAVKDFAS